MKHGTFLIYAYKDETGKIASVFKLGEECKKEISNDNYKRIQFIFVLQTC